VIFINYEKHKKPIIKNKYFGFMVNYIILICEFHKLPKIEKTAIFAFFTTGALGWTDPIQIPGNSAT